MSKYKSVPVRHVWSIVRFQRFCVIRRQCQRQELFNWYLWHKNIYIYIDYTIDCLGQSTLARWNAIKNRKKCIISITIWTYYCSNSFKWINIWIESTQNRRKKRIKFVLKLSNFWFLLHRFFLNSIFNIRHRELVNRYGIYLFRITW